MDNPTIEEALCNAYENKNVAPRTPQPPPAQHAAVRHTRRPARPRPLEEGRSGTRAGRTVPETAVEYRKYQHKSSSGVSGFERFEVDAHPTEWSRFQVSQRTYIHTCHSEH